MVVAHNSPHSLVTEWIRTGNREAMASAMVTDAAVANTCSSGWALQEALSRRGGAEIVSMILRATPLSLAFDVACEHRRPDLALEIVDQLAPATCVSPLVSGLWDVAERCLSRGADPNETTQLLDRRQRDDDVYRVTPLMLASGSSRMMRLLLERGADVGRRSSDGWTALHWAVVDVHHGGRAESKERAASIAALLGAGLDPNCATPEGITALHCAVAANERLVVEALLAAGANPDASTLEAACLGDLRLLAGTTPKAIAMRRRRTRGLAALFG